MRYSPLFVMVSCLAMISCQGKEGSNPPAPSHISFTASIEAVATKVVLDKDEDGAISGKMNWELDDEIVVTDDTKNTAIYRVKSITDGYASFVYKSGDILKGGPYTAVYAGGCEYVQTYGGKSTMPMTAKSSTSFLKFSVSGGILDISVESPTGFVSSISVIGTPVGGTESIFTLKCISAIPIDKAVSFPISLPEGEYNKIIIVNMDGLRSVNVINPPISVSSGKLSSITISGPLIFEVPDLSAVGAANCYIVSSPGRYRFKGTVKGPSATTLDSPASADVLWETFGTEEKPSVGSVIRNVIFEDGYVSFTASGRDGNSCVAVRNSSGTILWSWHIWVCAGFNPVATSQEFLNSGGAVMDRNLGAVSAEVGSVGSIGLMYQWGRKDPFLAGCRIKYEDLFDQELAASSVIWPEPVSSDEVSGNINYAVSHPMTFITANEKLMNWKNSQDNNLWQKSDNDKTVYDPCPYGWRVPNGANSSTWAAAFATTHAFPKGPWVENANGMDFGSENGKDKSRQVGADKLIWYPAAGYRDALTGKLYQAGRLGRYTTVACTHRYQYNFTFDSAGNVFPRTFGYHATALSVRCATDPKVQK